MTENNKNWLGQAEIPKSEAKNQIPNLVSAETLLQNQEATQTSKKPYNPRRMGRMKYFVHSTLIPMGIIILLIFVFTFIQTAFPDRSDNLFMFFAFLTLIAFLL